MSASGKRGISLSGNGEDGNRRRPGKRIALDPGRVFKDAFMENLRLLIREEVRGAVREEVGNAFRNLVPELMTSVMSRVSHDAPEVENEPHRKLVREELKALHGRRLLPLKSLQSSDGQKMQLEFRSSIQQPIYEGDHLKGVNEGKEHDEAIHIVLLDANTHEVVCSGPESYWVLEVAVLDSLFKDGDDFDQFIVKPREEKGKGALLVGNLKVKLNKGKGTLGKIRFTDNSSWTKCKTFLLAIRVASGCSESMHVQMGKTEPLAVLSLRGKANEKHDPPDSDDMLWRLKAIAKDGAFLKRLERKNINIVEHFCQHLFIDPKGLRKILGGRMNSKKWNDLKQQAKACKPNEALYVYYTGEGRKFGVVFNNLFGLVGSVIEGTVRLAKSDPFTQFDKDHLMPVVEEARLNHTSFIKYDSEFQLLNNMAQYSRDDGGNVGYLPEQVLQDGLVIARKSVEEDNMLIHSNTLHRTMPLPSCPLAPRALSLGGNLPMFAASCSQQFGNLAQAGYAFSSQTIENPSCSGAAGTGPSIIYNEMPGTSIYSSAPDMAHFNIPTGSHFDMDVSDIMGDQVCDWDQEGWDAYIDLEPRKSQALSCWDACIDLEPRKFQALSCWHRLRGVSLVIGLRKVRLCRASLGEELCA